MSTPEPTTQVVAFLPTADEPLTGKEQLDALQQALDPEGQVDLVVSNDPPPPVGRSWAFDFETNRFVRSANGKGPAGTTGEATLRKWVEKCLSTARGAHPIHPPGYGLLNKDDVIGGPVAAVPVDLETRIRDALTFHPRIVNVTDFGVDYELDDDYVSVRFTVVTDRDETLTFDQLQTAA